MENLPDRLSEYLSATEGILVFPTETSARSWAEYLVCDPERFGRTALRTDRCISWDACREQLFPRSDRRQPANRIYRSIFIGQLTAANRKRPFLSYLIPPEHARRGEVFSSSLAGLCPDLADMQRALAGREPESGLQLLAGDIDELYTRYQRFLDEHDLFEPGFALRRLAENGRRYLLCFPEAMNGFEEVSDQLAASDSVELLPAGEAALPRLAIYENQHSELHDGIRRVEELLQQGIPAEQITITLADYRGMIDDLAFQGRLRSLPLRFRTGRPLSEYPVSRLFRDLLRTRGEHFSLRMLRRLLLNPAYRWRHPELNRRLIQAGVDNSCLQNWRRSDGSEYDLWARRLERTADDELLAYYRLVKKSITAVVEAGDARQLQRQLQSIQKTLLEPYSEEEEHTASSADIFSFCLRQLDALAEALERIGESGLEGVYSLWLSLLESVWYVQQQEPDGISVYPYGVSAGIMPRYHLILGADKAHTTVTDDRLSLLSDQQKELLSRSPKDLSDQMLSVSCLSGERCIISCSRKSRSGQQLPPTRFLETGQSDEGSETLYPGDPYTRELELWQTGTAQHEYSWYPVQLRGYHGAGRTVLARGGLDLAESPAPVGSPARGWVRNHIEDAEGTIRLSPTSLDRFYSCPFSWFLSYVLKIEERDFTPDLRQARTIGKLIHTCCEQFFSWLAEEREGRFLSEDLEEYRSRLDIIMERQFELTARRRHAPAEAVRFSVEHFVRSHLPALLSAEAKVLDRWVSGELEAEYSRRDDENKMVLSGRIDRVALQPETGETAVIDYKKSCGIRPKSFGPDSPRPDSWQLPVYAWIVDREVSRALYYDVTDKKYISVLPYDYKGVIIDRERFSQVIEEALAAAGETAGRIRKADLPVTDDPRFNCRSCRFRDVCRGRFSVR